MFHRALAKRIATTLIMTVAGMTVFLLSAGSSHVLGAAPIQTRLSIVTGETHPYYPGAVKFKEALETESRGQILVQVFANAQIGDEAAGFQLLRSGTLQFAQQSSSLASSASNELKLQAWSLPFLYPDADAAYHAWDSELAVKSYAALEKSGVKCLARWDAGFRQLSANRPVSSMSDVRGLKIRTPDGAIYVSTWKALGAVPTPMAFTELYTALQTGVVDGTELPVQVFASSKFDEVQKNYAIINYMNDPICFSVSLKFFNGLSPELQQAVMKAAQASATANRQAARASFDKAIEQVKASGVKITRPDTEPFRKAVAPVYEDFYKKVGEDARGIVNAIIQLTKK